MRINELLGIKYPVFQGGMANISDGAFAAAISEAGALGIIGAGGMNAEALAEQIKICKERTDKPFGVNIMLMNPDADRMAKIAAKEGVAVITTGAGNPGKYMKMWNDAGIKVFPVVSGVALARRLEDSGAFGIIAEGCESGGHIGELTTMALVPQVVDAVKIPVIAAGGIASGRQMAAAFALGACGIQAGTMFLVSSECPVHENYKEAVIAARDTGTAVTGRSAGRGRKRRRVPRTRRGAFACQADKSAEDSPAQSAFSGAADQTRRRPLPFPGGAFFHAGRRRRTAGSGREGEAAGTRKSCL